MKASEKLRNPLTLKNKIKAHNTFYNLPQFLWSLFNHIWMWEKWYYLRLNNSFLKLFWSCCSTKVILKLGKKKKSFERLSWRWQFWCLINPYTEILPTVLLIKTWQYLDQQSEAETSMGEGHYDWICNLHNFSFPLYLLYNKN